MLEMNARRIIALGMIGYGLYRLYRTSGVTAIKFSFAGIKIDWKKLKIFFQLRVVNPSPISVSINGLTADIFYKGDLIGNIYSTESQTIPASGSRVLNFQVAPSAIDIFKVLKGLIKGNVNFHDPNFTVKGTVFLPGGIKLPLAI